MKTIEYVKKYNLSQTDKISHKHFALDFGNDFVSRLEVYRTFSKFSLSKFFDLLDEMENKWNQINKKTAGILPETLFNYIHSAIMMPSIDVEFPHIYETKNKTDNSNIEQLKVMVAEELSLSNYEIRLVLNDIAFEWNRKYNDNSIGELGLEPNVDFKKIATMVNNKDSYILYYIFDELTYQLKKLGASKAQVQFRIHVKERQRRENLFDWWSFISSQGIKVDKSQYQYYFSALNLTTESKEDDVKKMYRTLSMSKHPDKGGNKEEFVELTEAKNKCLEYLKLS